MKLVTYITNNGTSVGAIVNGEVIDLTAAGLPGSMVEFIADGSRSMTNARSAIERGGGTPLDSVDVIAPIPVPPKNVMAVGRNYHDHAQEFSDSGFDASEVKVIPDEPIIFTKASSSIVGPGVAIDTRIDPTHTVDYEGELGVIIGRRGRSIRTEDAMDYVFGYTVINDVTSRQLQKDHIQFFIGKSLDTFCPMGPNITTIDELPDITTSWLRTVVNGDLRQESPISALIFDIPTLIATISRGISLEPGDVIATGTPKGVGIGLTPPTFLAAGDIVEVSVDGVGSLSNPVV